VAVVEIIDIEDFKGYGIHSSFKFFYLLLLEKYCLNCYNLKYIKGEKKSGTNRRRIS